MRGFEWIRRSFGRSRSAPVVAHEAKPEIAYPPLRALVRDITASVNEAPVDFFQAVDRAKSRFRSEVGDDLESALIGLKIANLLISKHEYLRGSVVTVAHPVSFMLDTANQCQLGCPSCTNSFNKEVTEATFNPWPRGILKPERFRSFIETAGISSFAGHFYNNHEPFLNKNTPAYLRVASDMQIDTFVSSNLSFPKLDHDAIVLSGLQTLMVALDGVTQESYERYRKGGRIDWAFANVRAIADAKKRLGKTTPHLRWQWLTFKHNIHEVERGIEAAREVGFDSFNLATPNRVDQDDPTVHAVQYEGPDEHKEVVINPRVGGMFGTVPESYRDLIEERLAESALGRWEEAGGPRFEDVPDATGDRCDWLHMAVIGDAMGRIVPCCTGDYKKPGSFIFSSIDEHHSNIMNSRLYQESRMLLTNPTAFKSATAGQRAADRTRCTVCPVRPRPQVGLGAVHSWFAWSQKPQMLSFEPEETSALYDWSRHREIRPNYQSTKLGFAGIEEEDRFGNLDLHEIAGLGEVFIRESDTVLYSIDVYVRSGDALTAKLIEGGSVIREAKSSGSGWQHFVISSMITPGTYVLEMVAADQEPIEVASFIVAAGATVRIVPPHLAGIIAGDAAFGPTQAA